MLLPWFTAPKGRRHIATGVSPWDGDEEPISRGAAVEGARGAMGHIYTALPYHIVFATKNRTQSISLRLHDLPSDKRYVLG